MKVHLNRAGQSLGQFRPEEIRSGLRAGKFTGTDLVWRDGMASWRPLSEVIDEVAPETEEGALPPLPVRVEGLPWEHRGERGFFSAIFETIRAVLLEPKVAFAAMQQTGGLGPPLFFSCSSARWAARRGFSTQRFFTWSNRGPRRSSRRWRRS